MATLSEELYNTATGLWYTQADNHMRACGHPGVPGPTGGAEVADQELSYLQGAIKALQEVESKINRTGWAQGRRQDGTQ